jgi:phage terminase large subunit-like protein
MIDDVDKWNDLNELQKAMPNLGVSVSIDYMLEEIAIAEGSLSKKAEFLTKYCNIKQNSSMAWISTKYLPKICHDYSITPDSIAHTYVTGGIDLSQRIDLTSACVLCEQNGIIKVLSHFWLPEERLEEATARDEIPYWKYVKRGELTLCEGNYVNPRDVFEWFLKLKNEYEILPLQTGYDRYTAQELVQDMQRAGYHMDDVYQGYNLTGTIMTLEGLIKDGAIDFGDNELLKIHLLDVAIKVDNESRRQKIIKMNAKSHIDGIAAVLDALVVRDKWHNEIGDRLKNVS